jgi:hypothetical protein
VQVLGVPHPIGCKYKSASVWMQKRQAPAPIFLGTSVGFVSKASGSVCQIVGFVIQSLGVEFFGIKVQLNQWRDRLVQRPAPEPLPLFQMML